MFKPAVAVFLLLAVLIEDGSQKGYASAADKGKSQQNTNQDKSQSATQPPTKKALEDKAGMMSEEALELIKLTIKYEKPEIQKVLSKIVRKLGILTWMSSKNQDKWSNPKFMSKVDEMLKVMQKKLMGVKETMQFDIKAAEKANEIAEAGLTPRQSLQRKVKQMSLEVVGLMEMANKEGKTAISKKLANVMTNVDRLQNISTVTNDKMNEQDFIQRLNGMAKKMQSNIFKMSMLLISLRTTPQKKESSDSVEQTSVPQSTNARRRIQNKIRLQSKKRVPQRKAQNSIEQLRLRTVCIIRVQKNTGTIVELRNKATKMNLKYFDEPLVKLEKKLAAVKLFCRSARSLDVSKANGYFVNIEKKISKIRGELVPLEMKYNKNKNKDSLSSNKTPAVAENNPTSLEIEIRINKNVLMAMKLEKLSKHRYKNPMYLFIKLKSALKKLAMLKKMNKKPNSNTATILKFLQKIERNLLKLKSDLSIPTDGKSVSTSIKAEQLKNGSKESTDTTRKISSTDDIQSRIKTSVILAMKMQKVAKQQNNKVIVKVLKSALKKLAAISKMSKNSKNKPDNLEGFMEKIEVNLQKVHFAMKRIKVAASASKASSTNILGKERNKALAKSIREGIRSNVIMAMKLKKVATKHGSLSIVKVLKTVLKKLAAVKKMAGIPNVSVDKLKTFLIKIKNNLVKIKAVLAKKVSSLPTGRIKVAASASKASRKKILGNNKNEAMAKSTGEGIKSNVIMAMKLKKVATKHGSLSIVKVLKTVLKKLAAVKKMAGIPNVSVDKLKTFLIKIKNNLVKIKAVLAKKVKSLPAGRSETKVEKKPQQKKQLNNKIVINIDKRIKTSVITAMKLKKVAKMGTNSKAFVKILKSMLKKLAAIKKLSKDPKVKVDKLAACLKKVESNLSKIKSLLMKKRAQAKKNGSVQNKDTRKVIKSVQVRIRSNTVKARKLLKMAKKTGQKSNVGSIKSELKKLASVKKMIKNPKVNLTEVEKILGGIDENLTKITVDLSLKKAPARKMDVKNTEKFIKKNVIMVMKLKKLATKYKKMAIVKILHGILKKLAAVKKMTKESNVDLKKLKTVLAKINKNVLKIKSMFLSGAGRKNQSLGTRKSKSNDKSDVSGRISKNVIMAMKLKPLAVKSGKKQIVKMLQLMLKKLAAVKKMSKNPKMNMNKFQHVMSKVEKNLLILQAFFSKIAKASAKKTSSSAVDSTAMKNIDKQLKKHVIMAMKLQKMAQKLKMKPIFQVLKSVLKKLATVKKLKKKPNVNYKKLQNLMLKTEKNLEKIKRVLLKKSARLKKKTPSVSANKVKNKPQNISKIQKRIKMSVITLMKLKKLAVNSGKKNLITVVHTMLKKLSAIKKLLKDPKANLAKLQQHMNAIERNVSKIKSIFVKNRVKASRVAKNRVKPSRVAKNRVKPSRVAKNRVKASRVAKTSLSKRIEISLVLIKKLQKVSKKTLQPKQYRQMAKVLRKLFNGFSSLKKATGRSNVNFSKLKQHLSQLERRLSKLKENILRRVPDSRKKIGERKKLDGTIQNRVNVLIITAKKLKRIAKKARDKKLIQVLNRILKKLTRLGNLAKNPKTDITAVKKNVVQIGKSLTKIKSSLLGNVVKTQKVSLEKQIKVNVIIAVKLQNLAKKTGNKAIMNIIKRLLKRLAGIKKLIKRGQVNYRKLKKNLDRVAKNLGKIKVNLSQTEAKAVPEIVKRIQIAVSAAKKLRTVAMKDKRNRRLIKVLNLMLRKLSVLKKISKKPNADVTKLKQNLVKIEGNLSKIKSSLVRAVSTKVQKNIASIKLRIKASSVKAVTLNKKAKQDGQKKVIRVIHSMMKRLAALKKMANSPKANFAVLHKRLRIVEKRLSGIESSLDKEVSVELNKDIKSRIVNSFNTAVQLRKVVKNGKKKGMFKALSSIIKKLNSIKRLYAKKGGFNAVHYSKVLRKIEKKLLKIKSVLKKGISKRKQQISKRKHKKQQISKKKHRKQQISKKKYKKQQISKKKPQISKKKHKKPRINKKKHKKQQISKKKQQISRKKQQVTNHMIEKAVQARISDVKSLQKLTKKYQRQATLERLSRMLSGLMNMDRFTKSGRKIHRKKSNAIMRILKRYDKAIAQMRFEFNAMQKQRQNADKKLNGTIRTAVRLEKVAEKQGNMKLAEKLGRKGLLKKLAVMKKISKIPKVSIDALNKNITKINSKLSQVKSALKNNTSPIIKVIENNKTFDERLKHLVIIASMLKKFAKRHNEKSVEKKLDMALRTTCALRKLAQTGRFKSVYLEMKLKKLKSIVLSLRDQLLKSLKLKHVKPGEREISSYQMKKQKKTLSLEYKWLNQEMSKLKNLTDHFDLPKLLENETLALELVKKDVEKDIDKINSNSSKDIKELNSTLNHAISVLSDTELKFEENLPWLVKQKLKALYDKHVAILNIARTKENLPVGDIIDANVLKSDINDMLTSNITIPTGIEAKKQEVKKSNKTKRSVPTTVFSLDDYYNLLKKVEDNHRALMAKEEGGVSLAFIENLPNIDKSSKIALASHFTELKSLQKVLKNMNVLNDKLDISTDLTNQTEQLLLQVKNIFSLMLKVMHEVNVSDIGLHLNKMKEEIHKMEGEYRQILPKLVSDTLDREFNEYSLFVNSSKMSNVSEEDKKTAKFLLAEITKVKTSDISSNITQMRDVSSAVLLLKDYFTLQTILKKHMDLILKNQNALQNKVVVNGEYIEKRIGNITMLILIIEDLANTLGKSDVIDKMKPLVKLLSAMKILNNNPKYNKQKLVPKLVKMENELLKIQTSLGMLAGSGENSANANIKQQIIKAMLSLMKFKDMAVQGNDSQLTSTIVQHMKTLTALHKMCVKSKLGEQQWSDVKCTTHIKEFETVVEGIRKQLSPDTEKLSSSTVQVNTTLLLPVTSVYVPLATNTATPVHVAITVVKVTPDPIPNTTPPLNKPVAELSGMLKAQQDSLIRELEWMEDARSKIKYINKIFDIRVDLVNKANKLFQDMNIMQTKIYSIINAQNVEQCRSAINHVRERLVRIEEEYRVILPEALKDHMLSLHKHHTGVIEEAKTLKVSDKTLNTAISLLFNIKQMSEREFLIPDIHDAVFILKDYFDLITAIEANHADIYKNNIVGMTEELEELKGRVMQMLNVTKALNLSKDDIIFAETLLAEVNAIFDDLKNKNISVEELENMIGQVVTKLQDLQNEVAKSVESLKLGNASACENVSEITTVVLNKTDNSVEQSHEIASRVIIAGKLFSLNLRTDALLETARKGASYDTFVNYLMVLKRNINSVQHKVVSRRCTVQVGGKFEQVVEGKLAQLESAVKSKIKRMEVLELVAHFYLGALQGMGNMYDKLVDWENSKSGIVSSSGKIGTMLSNSNSGKGLTVAGADIGKWLSQKQQVSNGNVGLSENPSISDESTHNILSTKDASVSNVNTEISSKSDHLINSNQMKINNLNTGESSSENNGKALPKELGFELSESSKQKVNENEDLESAVDRKHHITHIRLSKQGKVTADVQETNKQTEESELRNNQQSQIGIINKASGNVVASLDEPLKSDVNMSSSGEFIIAKRIKRSGGDNETMVHIKISDEGNVNVAMSKSQSEVYVGSPLFAQNDQVMSKTTSHAVELTSGILEQPSKSLSEVLARSPVMRMTTSQAAELTSGILEQPSKSPSEVFAGSAVMSLTTSRDAELTSGILEQPSKSPSEVFAGSAVMSLTTSRAAELTSGILEQPSKSLSEVLARSPVMSMTTSQAAELTSGILEQPSKSPSEVFAGSPVMSLTTLQAAELTSDTVEQLLNTMYTRRGAVITPGIVTTTTTTTPMKVENKSIAKESVDIHINNVTLPQRGNMKDVIDKVLKAVKKALLDERASSAETKITDSKTRQSDLVVNSRDKRETVEYVSYQQVYKDISDLNTGIVAIADTINKSPLMANTTEIELQLIGYKHRLKALGKLLAPEMCKLHTKPKPTGCAAFPCKNSGVCVDKDDGSYTCTCPTGTLGDNCEFTIDKCGENPCKHGGTCLSATGYFECMCTPQWRGVLCEDRVRHCLSQPCQNQATCAETDGGYNCTCPPGFAGTNCQANIDECHSNPCQNQGKCIDLVNSYVCECSHLYTGALCEAEISICESNLCQHGGTCIPSADHTTYTCQCVTDFSGDNCEVLHDYCNNGHVPCMNNGTCIPTTDGKSYSCECAPNYSGTHCDSHLGSCFTNQCNHGGTCVPSGQDDNSFTCLCPNNYSGRLCNVKGAVTTTTRGHKGCSPNPCRDGELCRLASDNQTAICWDGNYKDGSPCIGAPCRNNATCTDFMDEGYPKRFSCECTPQYQGRLCSKPNPCGSGPCQNGGVCQTAGNNYRCVCTSLYHGMSCEQKLGDICSPNPCEPGFSCMENMQSIEGFICQQSGFKLTKGQMKAKEGNKTLTKGQMKDDKTGANTNENNVYNHGNHQHLSKAAIANKVAQRTKWVLWLVILLAIIIILLIIILAYAMYRLYKNKQISSKQWAGNGYTDRRKQKGSAEDRSVDGSNEELLNEDLDEDISDHEDVDDSPSPSTPKKRGEGRTPSSANSNNSANANKSNNNSRKKISSIIKNYFHKNKITALSDDDDEDFDYEGFQV